MSSVSGTHKIMSMAPAVNRRTDAVIFLASEAAVASRWCAVLRREIGTALDRGILLLPVLFDEARMPRRAELPDEIRALADQHTIRVNPMHLPDDLMRIELEVREALRARFGSSRE